MESAVADAADVEEKEVGPVDIVEIIDLTGVAPEDIPADLHVFEIVNLQGLAPHEIPHDVIPVELFPVDILGNVQTTGTVEASAGVSTSSAAGESASANASSASETGGVTIAESASVSPFTDSGSVTIAEPAAAVVDAAEPAQTEYIAVEPVQQVAIETKSYGTEIAEYEAPVEAPVVVETAKTDYYSEPEATKASYDKSAGYSHKSDGKSGKSTEGSNEVEGDEGSKEAEEDEE